jgi:thioredoxin reductase (NADPH)
VSRLDCLVVGAGPAGLTAAVYLARFHRSFQVIDGGTSRAELIAVSHNYPGFPEGISGPELLRRLRGQALRYGTRIMPGQVDWIERWPDGGFAIGVGGQTLMAERVLLATGAEDVEPPLPGVEDAVRRGLIRHCPICDAYEVTGQTVGLIGYGRCRVQEALLLRAYTDQLTLLTLGRLLELSAEDDTALQAAGVQVVRQPVARLTVAGGQIVSWHMQDGAEHHFDTLYSALGLRVRSGLATALGAKADEGGALLVDAHQRTTVEGLYAAGDVARGLSQISVAAGQAAVATADINRSLPFARAAARETGIGT